MSRYLKKAFWNLPSRSLPQSRYSRIKARWWCATSTIHPATDPSTTALCERLSWFRGNKSLTKNVLFVSSSFLPSLYFGQLWNFGFM